MARTVREPYDEGKEWLDNSRAGAAALANIAPIHQATVTLNNTEIKALPTAPQTIVDAPGSGKVFVLIIAALVLDSTAGAYTNLSAGRAALITNVAGANEFSVYATSFPAAGAGRDIRSLTGAAYQGTGDFEGLIDGGTLAENSPLILTVNNGASDFTGGHVNNTMVISVTYYVLDTVTGEFE